MVFNKSNAVHVINSPAGKCNAISSHWLYRSLVGCGKCARRLPMHLSRVKMPNTTTKTTMVVFKCSAMITGAASTDLHSPLTSWMRSICSDKNVQLNWRKCWFPILNRHFGMLPHILSRTSGTNSLLIIFDGHCPMSIREATQCTNLQIVNRIPLMTNCMVHIIYAWMNSTCGILRRLRKTDRKTRRFLQFVATFFLCHLCWAWF